MQQAFQCLDKNRNSCIEFKEFVAWWDGIPPNESLPPNHIKLRMEAFRRRFPKSTKLDTDFPSGLGRSEESGSETGRNLELLANFLVAHYMPTVTGSS